MNSQKILKNKKVGLRDFKYLEWFMEYIFYILCIYTNIVFRRKRKFYAVSGSDLPDAPTNKKLWLSIFYLKSISVRSFTCA